MENAVFTTLCMVYDDNDRILVQRRRGTLWDGLAFPGGHVERGESFVKSVTREVYEETGYRIKNPVLCGVKQFQTECGARYIVLLYKTGEFSGRLRSSDEGEVFWIARESLADHQPARDMEAMLELFFDEHKSEFYYLPDSEEDEYVIL